MGNSGRQDIIKKRQSTSPGVGRNAQKFDASVDVNLSNDRDYTAIFRKVLGHELSNGLSADIYLHCRLGFTSNYVGTKAPDCLLLGLPAVNASDGFDAFGTLATRLRRPAGGFHWSVTVHILG